MLKRRADEGAPTVAPMRSLRHPPAHERPRGPRSSDGFVTRAPAPLAERPYREPWRPPTPPPTRPPWMMLALVTLGCAWLLGFTTHKLATMAKLRGDTPGIAERAMVLDGEFRRFNAFNAEYTLRDPHSENPEPWRIQLTAAQMVPLRFGDTLRVRCVDDERQCYLRGSVYIDDGNLGFDHGLQRIELAGLAGCVAVLLRRLVRWRLAVRAWRRS